MDTKDRESPAASAVGEQEEGGGCSGPGLGSCLVLLEYGIPQYREFIYDHLRERFQKLDVIHTGERFSGQDSENVRRAFCLRLGREVTLCFFNPFVIQKYDFVLATLNWRKPHTWLWSIFFRRPEWIFWGQGPGRAKNSIFGAIKGWIIRRAKGFIVYTEGGLKSLVEIGVKASTVAVAFNSLQVANAGPTGSGRYFLYVGRVQRRKGLDELVQAVRGTQFKVVIVGDSEAGEVARLMSLAEVLGVSGQVDFQPGTFSDERLRQYFDGAWAYVSPNHVGLGVVHSFSYGKPVVTRFDVKHAPEFEYCSAENSYLYQGGDDLTKVLADVAGDSFVWARKCRSAYDFYQSKLDARNVTRAFDHVLGEL